ncbi:MAG: hypothetical protein ACXAEU_10995 [Candidatus Hodarchaeales archaeon]|jgi:hypothetical protein
MDVLNRPKNEERFKGFCRTMVDASRKLVYMGKEDSDPERLVLLSFDYQDDEKRTNEYWLSIYQKEPNGSLGGLVVKPIMESEKETLNQEWRLTDAIINATKKCLNPKIEPTDLEGALKMTEDSLRTNQDMYKTSYSIKNYRHMKIEKR